MNWQEWRTAPIVLCSVAILLSNVLFSAADESNVDLQQVVVKTSDALLEHGRDRWGPVQSHMIISMLDRHTLKPCKKLPKGAWGVRNSDRTTIYGSNVNMQQNLFRTFYLLSRITRDSKYGDAADAALLDFVHKTQVPATGLLAWGEHLCWDLQQDQAATMAQKLIHEPKKPLVFWDFLYEHEPRRTLAYATGIWKHQIADHESGNFSRHARYDQHGPGKGYDFTKEAGYFIDIWARAFAASADESYARAIETLVRRYSKRLNDRNLLDYDGVRPNYCNNGHNITLAAELHDSSSRVAEYENGRLSNEMMSLATAIDRGFLALNHRPDAAEAGFIATSTTKGGEPRDRDGPGPGGYSIMWGMGYGRQTSSMIAMHCFRRARQLGRSDEADRYRQLALSASRAYGNAGAPLEAIDLWPVESGTVVLMHLAAYQEANDEFHLRQARCRAEEAVRLFWDDSSPLPKTSRRRDHYETITGAETLLLALLAVHIAEEELQLGIPFSDIDR